MRHPADSLTGCLGAFDAGPEVLHAVVGFGGDGQDFFEAQSFFQGQQISGALVAAETVDLGGDHGEVAACGAEPVNELAVAFLGGTFESTRQMQSLSVERMAR